MRHGINCAATFAALPAKNSRLARRTPKLGGTFPRRTSRCSREYGSRRSDGKVVFPLLRHLHELSQAMVNDFARFQAAVETRARRVRFEMGAWAGEKIFARLLRFFHSNYAC